MHRNDPLKIVQFYNDLKYIHKIFEPPPPKKKKQKKKKKKNWKFPKILEFKILNQNGPSQLIYENIRVLPSSLNQNLACWLKCLFYTIYASKGGRLWQVCTFALSCLGLRHKWRLNAIFASSEGSGESAHLHRLTLAFATVQNLMCCLKWRFVCYSRQQRVLW